MEKTQWWNFVKRRHRRRKGTGVSHAANSASIIGGVKPGGSPRGVVHIREIATVANATENVTSCRQIRVEN